MQVLTEASVEDAVRRVLVKMTDDLVRRIVVETAERLIREEIEKIKLEEYRVRFGVRGSEFNVRGSGSADCAVQVRWYART